MTTAEREGENGGDRPDSERGVDEWLWIGDEQ
jgi:hypothetical protein